MGVIRTLLALVSGQERVYHKPDESMDQSEACKAMLILISQYGEEAERDGGMTLEIDNVRTSDSRLGQQTSIGTFRITVEKI